LRGSTCGFTCESACVQGAHISAVRRAKKKKAKNQKNEKNYDFLTK
jgi:hypothetical protein